MDVVLRDSWSAISSSSGVRPDLGQSVRWPDNENCNIAESDATNAGKPIAVPAEMPSFRFVHSFISDAGRREQRRALPIEARSRSRARVNRAAPPISVRTPYRVFDRREVT